MEYIEVKALTQEYCNELIDMANLNPTLYKNSPSSFPLEEKFAKGNTMIYLKTSLLKDFIVEGADKQKAKNDSKNSQIIYKALVFKDKEGAERVLTPLEASDRRIWMFLSHSDFFWKYMNIRWGGDNPDITSRFLITGDRLGLTSGKLIRHGISRLWWSAALCYDEKNHAEPFDLLNYLFYTTDFQLQLTDRRAISDNQKILKTYLRFLKKNKSFQNEGKNRKLAKSFTAETGIRDIPMLSESEIFELLNQIGAEIK